MSTSTNRIRGSVALGSVAFAVALGGTATAAPAGPSTSKAAPVTRLTLEDHKIVGLPKSFAPGWHTFTLSQKAKDGRELALLQPHAGTTWTTVKNDIDNGLVKLGNDDITAKTLGAYKKLTKEATFLGGVNVLPEFGTQTSTFTVKLVPGTVVLRDDNVDNDGTPTYAVLPVTSGQSVGSQPKASASIVAHEYGFLTSGVKAGKRTYTLHNGGKEPQEFILEYISPDHSDADVLTALQAFSNGTALPAWINDAGSDDIVSAGQSTTVTLDLKAGGHYLLFSFTPDLGNGLPTLFDGMYKQLHI